MTWINKFDYVKHRQFEEVLEQWAARSPVGVEVGQHPLANHISELVSAAELKNDGVQYIGPIESRPLLSEIYVGVTKAFNLNFHAQGWANSSAYTNGSLHAFNSVVQFMLAIISLFGIFVIRIGGRYFVVDVFPWLGHLKENKRLEKQFGKNWSQYARIISDPKQIIEQGEIVALFQRCLRVVTGLQWKDVLVNQLIEAEGKWFNRPRNSILYNFTGWSDEADIRLKSTSDCSTIIRSAAASIFDFDMQCRYGPLPQSLLLGSFLKHTWAEFRKAMYIQIAGTDAPEYPAVGQDMLIAEFEGELDKLLNLTA